MIACNRNVTALLFVALTTACASPQTVEIRPLGRAPTASAPVATRVAEGRAQLMLGDAGLALESFRRALAADPESISALQGIAACYDLMGRSDLSRRYYEQALAIAPRNRETLGALATSLASQGLDQEAAAVRNEMAAAITTSDPGLPVLVRVMLPPARPLDATPEPASMLQDRATGPRLERLSFGEVALVTLPTVPLAPSAQRAVAVAERAKQAGVPARTTVRLLNAARRQGLAAQARDLIERQGWRQIIIGDASRTRLASLILYPAGHEVAARRLGVRFNGDLRRQIGAGREIVVLLGRDALSSGSTARAG